MTRGIRPSLRRQTGAWLLSLVGASLLLTLGLWGFYRSGDPLVAPALILSGDGLRLTNGAGGAVADGVRVDALGANGNAVIQAVIQPFAAADYAGIAWQLDGIQDGMELRLIWSGDSDPRSIQARPVSSDADGRGRIHLAADPGWRGRILALGLVVLGEMHGPVLVRRIELSPRPLSFSALVEAVFADWTFREGWSGRSPNFNRGAPIAAPLPPVLLVALWVGLASLLYASISPPWRFPSRPLPYIAFAILGWALLDARWQWDLIQRLRSTEQTYAGLADVDRQLVGLHPDFYSLLMELRSRLADASSRILIIASDPFGYAAMRTRYHLAPLNVFSGLSVLPEASQVRQDDYILLIHPLSRVRYDGRRHALVSGDRTLPVEWVDGRSGLGALFRVRGAP